MSEPDFPVLDTEQACRAFTRETLAELKDVGADMEEPHVVEHHLFCEDFDRLEKAVVELAKQGYDVEDADEVEMDDGSTGFCCDALTESPLTQDALNAQTDLIIALAEKFSVEYDGWGTYLPELDGDDEDEEEEPAIH